MVGFGVHGSTFSGYRLGGIGGNFQISTGIGEAPVAPLLVPAASAAAAVTGVNPVESAYSLYGHIVPLSVFGVGRIGGEIISGPWRENGLASFIISFGVPADPSGTRDLREIAFDSEVVWTAAGGFTTEPFTYRFYGGTLTQAADTLEIEHFGVNAVAYRPQILLAFSNLPLANTKFGAIPYVSAVIGDASGDDVNLGEAFERLAYSPWVGWTSAEFETIDITDGLADGGLIIAHDTDFLSLAQQFGRFYSSWDILQTDKLRIVDRSSTVGADITLDTTRLMDEITVTRQGQDTVRKDLELSTIDPDADYTIIASVAQRPRDPVAVTTSVGKDSAYLPAIMDASTRIAIVTLARYHEEHTRKTISGTAMAYGLEIEPGTKIFISDLSDDFHNETFKVVETLHGANYVVEFTAAAILKCLISDADDFLDYVVLLMGFEGTSGSTGSPGMDDESPHLWVTAQSGADNGMGGGALIDRSQQKFGRSSISFDGFSAIRFLGLSPGELALLQFGANDFTVEMFIYPGSVSGTQFLVGRWDGGFLLGSISWIFYLDGNDIVLNLSTTGVDNIEVARGGTITTGAWQCVCVDYDGTKYRLYQDGVMVASSVSSYTMYNPGTVTPTLSIGSNNLNDAFWYTGYIDELRITNGIARYASDSGYTVPTSAFPRT